MDNVIKEKSYSFALRIIELCNKLAKEQKEFTLSRQLTRSGTAIGALVRESEHAESKQDFIHKMSIALKEANETEYWLMLLNDSGYIATELFDSLRSENIEIIKLLISIVKTSKRKNKQ